MSPMRDGQTTTNEQGKIVLLSQWMLDGWVSQFTKVLGFEKTPLPPFGKNSQKIPFFFFGSVPYIFEFVLWKGIYNLLFRNVWLIDWLFKIVEKFIKSLDQCLFWYFCFSLRFVGGRVLDEGGNRNEALGWQMSLKGSADVWTVCVLVPSKWPVSVHSL